jgi:hypothetical protein
LIEKSNAMKYSAYALFILFFAAIYSCSPAEEKESTPPYDTKRYALVTRELDSLSGLMRDAEKFLEQYCRNCVGSSYAIENMNEISDNNYPVHAKGVSSDFYVWRDSAGYSFCTVFTGGEKMYAFDTIRIKTANETFVTWFAAGQFILSSDAVDEFNVRPAYSPGQRSEFTWDAEQSMKILPALSDAADTNCVISYCGSKKVKLSYRLTEKDVKIIQSLMTTVTIAPAINSLEQEKFEFKEKELRWKHEQLKNAAN